MNKSREQDKNSVRFFRFMPFWRVAAGLPHTDQASITARTRAR